MFAYAEKLNELYVVVKEIVPHAGISDREGRRVLGIVEGLRHDYGEIRIRVCELLSDEV